MCVLFKVIINMIKVGRCLNTGPMLHIHIKGYDVYYLNCSLHILHEALYVAIIPTYDSTNIKGKN